MNRPQLVAMQHIDSRTAAVPAKVHGSLAKSS
jgi:hypothetical protein